MLGSESDLVRAVGASSVLLTMLEGVLAAGLSRLWGEEVKGCQQWKLQPRGMCRGESRQEGWGSSSAAVAELYGHNWVPTSCHLLIIVTTVVLCLSGD